MKVIVGFTCDTMLSSDESWFIHQNVGLYTMALKKDELSWGTDKGIFHCPWGTCTTGRNDSINGGEGYIIMQTSWKRLETQLSLLASSIKESLEPGAFEATLQHAETFLSITLPEEVKALYRIHDGQADHHYLGEDTGIVNGWYFFSLKSMCSSWLCEWHDLGPPGSFYNLTFPSPTQEQYPALWHPKWLPFMGHWMGPKYCIDLAPGPRGRMAQILLYNDRYKEFPDSVERAPSIRVVAPGIQEFFSRLTNDLEAGIYTFDEATGMLWDKEMFSAIAATEARVSGLDKETGEHWKDNDLGFLRRKHKERQRYPLPVRDELDWEDLYRDHPIFGSPELPNFDD